MLQSFLELEDSRKTCKLWKKLVKIFLQKIVAATWGLSSVTEIRYKYGSLLKLSIFFLLDENFFIDFSL